MYILLIWSSEFAKLTNKSYLVWKWFLCDLFFIHHYTIDHGPVFANWNFANCNSRLEVSIAFLFQNITLTTFMPLCNKMSFTALMYSFGAEWGLSLFLSSLGLVHLFPVLTIDLGGDKTAAIKTKPHWPSFNDIYCPYEYLSMVQLCFNAYFMQS